MFKWANGLNKSNVSPSFLLLETKRTNLKDLLLNPDLFCILLQNELKRVKFRREL